MTLVNTVLRVIADVTGVPSDKLDESSSVETVETWDSMAHINIVLSLEACFGVAISPEQAGELLSVSDIVAFLRQRTG